MEWRYQLNMFKKANIESGSSINNVAADVEYRVL